MKVIKRSGKEVNFDKVKIEQALLNANESVDDKKFQLKPAQIEKITSNVIAKCEALGRAVHVEEIQRLHTIIAHDLESAECRYGILLPDVVHAPHLYADANPVYRHGAAG